MVTLHVSFKAFLTIPTLLSLEIPEATSSSFYIEWVSCNITLITSSDEESTFPSSQSSPLSQVSSFLSPCVTLASPELGGFPSLRFFVEDLPCLIPEPFTVPSPFLFSQHHVSLSVTELTQCMFDICCSSLTWWAHGYVLGMCDYWKN